MFVIVYARVLQVTGSSEKEKGFFEDDIEKHEKITNHYSYLVRAPWLLSCFAANSIESHRAEFFLIFQKVV